MFLSVFLIFLLSLSAVSAEDNSDMISKDYKDINSNLNMLDVNADDTYDDYDDYDDLSDDNIEKNNEFNKLSSSNLANAILYDSNSSLTDDSSSNISNEEENEIAVKKSYLSLISDKNWKINGTGETYLVKLTDEDGNPIDNADVLFDVKSSSESFDTVVQTDDMGIASLYLELSYPGAYTIVSSFDGDENYNASADLSSKVLVYKPTQIKLAKSYGYRGENFTIKLYGNGELLKNKKITVTVGAKKYSKITDSKGLVTVKLPSDVSKVLVTCHFEAEGYYHSSDLSKNISVYKRTFTKNNVYSLLRRSYFKVVLKGTDGKILAGQNVTITVCGKKYFRKTNSKGQVSLKINLVRGEYKISYSFDNNGIYGPSSNSTKLNVIDPSGQYKKLLNVKTSASVKKYLSGGGYAAVTTTIKNLAKSITKKYNNKFDKAVAIFNYVRDTLDYQYYANTRKGATKTYKTKAGNCCDHANLIVALCRASGIPARYSHSRHCKFKSGVEGHVWAQIYVGGTWYSADATSYRNSLGHVANWNTKTNKVNYNYRNLPF